MNKIFKTLFILALLVIVASVPLIAAQAAPAIPQESPPALSLDFSSLVNTLASLTGVAALIAAIVNLLKYFGVVGDGQAGAWSSGLNLIALAALLYSQIAGYASLIPAIDEQAGALAVVLSTFAAYIYQLIISRKTHDAALAGLPVIGKSNSNRVAGEQVTVIEAEYPESVG